MPFECGLCQRMRLGCKRQGMPLRNWMSLKDTLRHLHRLTRTLMLVITFGFRYSIVQNSYALSFAQLQRLFIGTSPGSILLKTSQQTVIQTFPRSTRAQSTTNSLLNRDPRFVVRLSLACKQQLTSQQPHVNSVSRSGCVPLHTSQLDNCYCTSKVLLQAMIC